MLPSKKKEKKNPFGEDQKVLVESKKNTKSYDLPILARPISNENTLVEFKTITPIQKKMI